MIFQSRRYSLHPANQLFTLLSFTFLVSLSHLHVFQLFDNEARVLISGPAIKNAIQGVLSLSGLIYQTDVHAKMFLNH